MTVLDGVVVEHEPVLRKEVIEGLQIRDDGLYVDATFGRGGHARALLEHLGARGQLVLLDRDPAAIAYARQHFAEDARVSIHHSSFADAVQHLPQWIKPRTCINGVMFDLGVSSPQLDESQRGFSFMRNGPLDMRMDPSSGESAAQWLSKVEEKELTHVIRSLGEERFAKRIAIAICNARDSSEWGTTTALASVVSAAVPFYEKHKHPATRTFQAIRMFVNRELDEIRDALPAFVDQLCDGGRMAVISFHSLEDRIAKQLFKKLARGDDFPPDLAVRADQLNPIVKIVGRLVKPSDDEIARNTRARSARLRIVEKLVVSNA